MSGFGKSGHIFYDNINVLQLMPMDRQLLMLRMVASYDTLETASSIHLFTRNNIQKRKRSLLQKQANRVNYLIMLVVRYFLTITARNLNQDIAKII